MLIATIEGLIAADFEALIADYLETLHRKRALGAGTAETSYYAALESLLGGIGTAMEPKVYCLSQLQNTGAGHPDFGLFTARQVQRGEPRPGQMPERGVIEVKPVADETWLTADTRQVSRYWDHYRLVLVTNYRSFLLLGQDAAGQPVRLEQFSLADSDPEFWREARHPQKAAKRLGRPFGEYLTRVLGHAAALTEPKDVAWFLASYARDALARVEGQAGLPALVQVKAALEAALGIGFTGAKALHFFHSTLVQTLFYGLFSAWVLWARDPRHGRFDWRLAAWYLRVPIIRSLFHQLADPTKLAPLGLVEVMDWAAATLDRVDRTRFFAKFEEAQAVQYFYEPFLAAYDPQLRKELGVWYTPREIVTYMVERVDRVLRSELGIARGLADERVHVLDPCCGTGAYLVEVLRRIDRTLSGEGLGGLRGLRLKAAALSRIHGFEIMPAPFVVAHLQIGLFLQALQAPLAEDGSERTSIWLTNALTGWNEASDSKARLLFQELEDERDHARHVKREAPILVVIGNPPYNAFAGTSPDEEEGLVEPYKAGLVKIWGIKKFNLDELYIRFLRIAERRIIETTGEGIICYISSYSYISDASFVVMRQRLLRGFDGIWIDSLNGDSRETGKLTPDGLPDPLVFSTEQNREGIQLGTAIGLMVRQRGHRPLDKIAYREFWGLAKRTNLLASLNENSFEDSYTWVVPTPAKRFSFRPREIAAEYAAWPRLVDLAATEPFSGLSEKREGTLIDIDENALKQRMRRYLDPLAQWEDLKIERVGPVKNAAAFDTVKARKRITERESFHASNLMRFAAHPLDVQWCYHTAVPGIWNRARPEFAEQVGCGNRFLVTRMAGRRPDEGCQ